MSRHLSDCRALPVSRLATRLVLGRKQVIEPAGSFIALSANRPRATTGERARFRQQPAVQEFRPRSHEHDKAGGHEHETRVAGIEGVRHVVYPGWEVLQSPRGGWIGQALTVRR